MSYSKYLLYLFMIFLGMTSCCIDFDQVDAIRLQEEIMSGKDHL